MTDKQKNPRIQSVSLKRSSTGRYLVLWGATAKEIPFPPDPNLSLTEDDIAYWYDREYSGWNVEKVNIPKSPRTGASGKSVIYLQPGADHPYMESYTQTVKDKCAQASIDLTVLNAQWCDKCFEENVNQAIGLQPDLILLNPEDQERSDHWYRRINEAGIPVVGGNFLADNEGHRYLLAWTGPDDWGQSRMLARRLADCLGHKGGYAILQHKKGNSSYYARTWGVISELKEYAPGMHHLASAPGMNPDDAVKSVEEWLTRFGDRLKGIFCADDGEVMKAVSAFLSHRSREDIKCVAAGSSRTGLELILAGKLEATSYQSPVIDAETAVQSIVDWFDGLPVEPIRYLPKHIVTRKDAADFLDDRIQISSLNLDRLYTHIREYNWKGSYNFFGDLYDRFLTAHVIPSEMFQGICLEILTGIIIILSEDGLSVEDTIGSYDSLAKHIFNTGDIPSVLEWMNDMCQRAIAAKAAKLNRKTAVQEIIEFIESHYREPLSLKSLAHQFSISQAYLGQMFRKEKGEKFNDYLNRKRIENAKIMLLGENVTINRIARELGYSDPAYFYKVFKKIAGLSASDYIKQNSL